MFFGLFKSKKPEEKILDEKFSKKPEQANPAQKVQDTLVNTVEPKPEPKKEEPNPVEKPKVEVPKVVEASKIETSRQAVEPPRQAVEPIKTPESKPQPNIQPKLPNPFIGDIIKSLVYLSIGIVMVGANFFIEGKFVESKEVIAPAFSQLDYASENIIPDNAIIRFADESTSGFKNSMSVASINQDSNQYIFKLDSAKLWGNFTISDAKVNIVAGERVVIIPNHAVFDLEFDGEKILLSVFDGDVYLGFLNEGIQVNEYQDQYSALFMNKLLIPRDIQVTVPLKKIDAKLQSVLYLKLVKEFKYYEIPAATKDSAWAKENLIKDTKYTEIEKQNLVSDIIFGGTSVRDSLLSEAIFWSEENLTFVPDKNHKMIFNHLFSYLDDAIFYANEGDQSLSNASFENFNSYLATLPSSISQGEEYFSKFDFYINRLSVFGPDDPPYYILKKLLDKKFFEGRDRYSIVNLLWGDVYKGINQGSAAAESALNNYYSYLDSTIGDRSNMEFYEDYISYQNQLFDNLFIKYSLFYKDGYFAMKNVLEQELLSIYEDNDLQEELTQELISNKIDFLKRLMKFFFDEEIEVPVAKEILSRLIEEINDLMPSDDDNTAVIELFETRLKDIGNFWGYLSSPEYYTSKTYGLTHEERYKSYLEEKDRIWDFINIQEEVLGENVKEVTIDDVVEEIEGIFTANVDVSEIEVLNFEDISQRYVDINGIIGGYPFEAVYDRDNNLLKDVYAYGELVSDRAVQLESLVSLLQEKFADLAVEDSGTTEEENTIEHYAERAARAYIAKLLSDYGFKAEMENITVVDELNALYRVDGVYLEGKEDMIFTFDFMMNGEKATNLYLTVKGEPVVMEGKYTLEELKNIAVAENDFNAEDGGQETEDQGVLR